MRLNILKIIYIITFFILTTTQVYADCVVNGTSYKTITGSGTEVTRTQMLAWSSGDVTTCDVTDNSLSNMSELFKSKTGFNQDLSAWNTINVTDMSAMFYNAYRFNQDIGDWNTSNVTNMTDMFRTATDFNQAIGDWDTSNVTDMSYMFNRARNFNQNIGDWDTSNVTDMSYMFDSAYKFNKDIGDWNTSNVINMGAIFSSAVVFNKNIGNWNTSNVTNMASMFNNARTFNQNIGNWDTSKVTSMRSIFSYASAFNQNIADWDTSNVTDMISAFVAAPNFNQDIRRWNVTNVTSFSGMFQSATLMNSAYSAPATPTASFFNVTPPTISSVSLNSDNSALTVTFNESVYDTTGGSGDLEVADFALSISGGSATLNSATPTSIAKTSQSVWVLGFSTTGTANGSETITVVPASSISIYDGDANYAATSQSNNTASLNEKTAPTLSSVSIASNNSTSTQAIADDVVTLTFTASETISTPVVTFKSGGAAITDTSVTYVNTSGNIWTAAYTANASDTEGTISYSIAFSDTAENAGTAVTSGSGSVTFDGTAPTMTITATNSDSQAVSDGATSKDGALLVTFTASEATTDFVVGDITVSGGALSNFVATSSTVYTATFTPSGAGATTIDVASSKFTDAAGNNNTAATQFNWTYDGTAPTMAITAAEISDGGTSNDATLSLTFTSSEATTNFVVGDITVSGGALSSFAASSSTVYTATFTPSASGATTIDVAGGVFTDAAGNNNTAATQFNWTYDTTAACTVNGQDYRTIYDTSGTYITLSNLTSRASSWNNSTDLVTTCDVSQFTSMYEAFKNNSTFNQDISAWDTSAVTSMDSMFYGATAFNQDLSDWNTSAVTNMNRMFQAATNITSVSFNNTSAVTGMSRMFQAATNLTSVSFPDTSSVTNMYQMFGNASSFNYDIRGWNVGNVTTFYRMFLGAVSFNQDIRSWDVDNVTNFSSMFDNATAMSAKFSTTANWANTPTAAWFTPDTTAPTMTITASEVSDGGTSNDGTLSLTFTSSEATTDFVVGDITVSGGALSSFAASSSTVYTATFTPSGAGATTIDVASSKFTDAAGNNNTAATQFNWTYDGTAPTLSSVSIASNNSTSTQAVADDVVTLTFTASEAIATPVVTFQSGGAAITDTSVTYVNTSGNTWTAAYTVNASDTSGAVTFSIAFTDTVGNAGTAVTATSDSTSVTASLDTIAPTLSSVSIVTNNAITSVANDGDVVTLTLTASEAISLQL